MRLTKIKLAGFKSFVDPVTFYVPGQLLAVVGPNGCGKSNIIDAVRWVMGESAASHLRGDSLDDVIFNGSDHRKPVGQALVELVFDNDAGRLEGPWSQYAEISIKRVAARGAQSTYYINGTRCRRRDIAAIFLGTGLGPRSYAIIEQGTISRIIDSKPGELRVFLEEAAGVSKYKERRRETANRIRHSRENLERLNDLRDEQQKQLQHVQRQARNAERYRELRAEQRLLKAQLLALRWRGLDQSFRRDEQRVNERQTEIESQLAEQRHLETTQTADRVRHSDLSDALNTAQERHYQMGTEVARAEQTLAHQQQLRQRLHDEQIRTEQSLSQLVEQTHNDEQRLEQIVASIAANATQHAAADATAQQALAQRGEAEAAVAEWQTSWEVFAAVEAEAQRAADVERVRIEQIERQQLLNQRQIGRLELERSQFDPQTAAAELDAFNTELIRCQDQFERSSAALVTLEERVEQLRDQVTDQERECSDMRDQRQSGRGRLSSLQTLQQAALNQTDSETEREHKAGISAAPRLAECVQAASGWEAAVETVLGAALAARCVDHFPIAVERAVDETIVAGVAVDKMAPFTLLDMRVVDGVVVPGSLGSKLDGPAVASELVAGVAVADSLEQALARRSALAPGESLVTRDGIWIGRGWLRLAGGTQSQAGLLARGREIDTLGAALSTLDEQIADIEVRLDGSRIERQQLADQLQQTRDEHTQQQRELVQIESRVETGTERWQQQQQRQIGLSDEFNELREQIDSSQVELGESRRRLEQALAAMDNNRTEREQRAAQRQQYQLAHREARTAAELANGNLQRLSVTLESSKREQTGIEQALLRLAQQRERLSGAQQQLNVEAQRASTESDGDELQAQLEEWLQQRVASEADLTTARQQLSVNDDQLRHHERALAELGQRQQQSRDLLAEQRLKLNETGIHRQTLVDQLVELDTDPGRSLADLPEQANDSEWQQRLEKTGERIQRLGAINLAAIEELKTLAERNTYLDAQYNDLIEALATLEEAMAKIDRETRARFLDTFNRVNEGLQTLFPRLFGGGQAYLDLTSSDALEAGVTIMARPPGKRNGTIHLLSGGEKALTAVAMIFSIFQLNPAPFCMLDEVDAPLDDANVGRFSQLLREMSSQIQFIVVSHNKGTMEVASHLSGVTMHEPGVSRIVAVDIDEAVRLAAV